MAADVFGLAGPTRILTFRKTPAIVPPPPAPVHRFVLVDKPGAAQSEIRIGEVGLARRHTRLPSADRAEHDPRRAVRQPHQHEAAAGEGADLRGENGVRFPARARTVHSADQRAERRNRRRPIKSSLLEIHAIRTDRPPTADEVEVAKAALDARVRAEFRDGRTDCPGHGPARACMTFQTTISTHLRQKLMT